MMKIHSYLKCTEEISFLCFVDIQYCEIICITCVLYPSESGITYSECPDKMYMFSLFLFYTKRSQLHHLWGNFENSIYEKTPAEISCIKYFEMFLLKTYFKLCSKIQNFYSLNFVANLLNTLKNIFLKYFLLNNVSQSCFIFSNQIFIIFFSQSSVDFYTVCR